MILSFAPWQGKYFNSLPLHHSQEIITDNDKELRLRLHLAVTYDFLMEIRSYGREVEVVKPEGLLGYNRQMHFNRLLKL